MPTVRFTQNIQRHVKCPERAVPGATVREALGSYFALHEQARGYVLDDQTRLRHHMAIFIDGNQVLDRENLSDPVPPNGTIDIVQALSGGKI
jgi:molybdopterin synthase sulfur carrier subunit